MLHLIFKMWLMFKAMSTSGPSTAKPQNPLMEVKTRKVLLKRETVSPQKTSWLYWIKEFKIKYTWCM